MMNKRVFCSIGLAALLALWIRWGIPDIGNLLGGPSWITLDLPEGPVKVDTISAWWMMNWFLLFSPAWILGLWNYEDDLNRAHICIYRYLSVGHWWVRLYGRMILNVMVSYLVIGVLLRLLIGSDWTPKFYWCMLLITIHALFSLAFAIWIRLLSGNMILAAVCSIVLEGIAKISVVLRVFKPAQSMFSWGMYHYSRYNYGAGGFEMPIVIVLQLCIVLSLLLLLFGKGKEILLRRINDGKVH